MNAIFLAISVFRTVFSFGRIFMNAGKIIRFYKTVAPVGQSLINERRLPRGPESKAVIHSLADLMRAKVIDLPGVDEEQIAKALEEIEAEIAA